MGQVLNVTNCCVWQMPVLRATYRAPCNMQDNTTWDEYQSLFLPTSEVHPTNMALGRPRRDSPINASLGVSALAIGEKIRVEILLRVCYPITRVIRSVIQ